MIYHTLKSFVTDRLWPSLVWWFWWVRIGIEYGSTISEIELTLEDDEIDDDEAVAFLGDIQDLMDGEEE